VCVHLRVCVRACVYVCFNALRGEYRILRAGHIHVVLYAGRCESVSASGTFVPFYKSLRLQNKLQKYLATCQHLIEYVAND
jgi:hypothetical protein